MHAIVDWLKASKLWVGLAADVLTFAGGLLLARDAFTHLKDFHRQQIEAEFQKHFPNLQLAAKDGQEDEAEAAGRWAYRGLFLLVVGFLCEIASRFAE